VVSIIVDLAIHAIVPSGCYWPWGPPKGLFEHQNGYLRIIPVRLVTCKNTIAIGCPQTYGGVHKKGLLESHINVINIVQ
jgi:hypothetical protein